MRIYTKSGDKGQTGLLGGSRVSKSDARIDAIGDSDELNALLGISQTYVTVSSHEEIITRIQNDLFTIGAELADPEKKSKITYIEESRIELLEKDIDAIEMKVTPLVSFILPGGTPFSAHAHHARTVCRRAERSIVALGEKGGVRGEIIKYLNRLSDLLFMLAREDMHEKKVAEIEWKADYK